MSAEDILRQKQRKRQVKNSSNPSILRQKRATQKPIMPKYYPSVNRYVNNSKNTIQLIQGKLTAAQMAGFVIGKSAKAILDATTKNLKLLTIAGLGLLTVIGYLKEKHTYDTQGYSNIDRFLGREPGVSGGFGSFAPSGRSSGTISAKGLQMIKNKEGFRSKAYQDEGGIWTIGYGHTGNVKPGDTITKEKAETLLRSEVKKFENTVNKKVKVPISQNMFDALTVLCYNIGQGAFSDSTLLKKLNAGDYRGAQAQFAVWNKVKDKNNNYVVSEGLTKRRAEEAALFGIDITPDNKLKGEVINKEIKRETIQATSSGNRQRYTTGKTTSSSNPKIGNYQLWNPNTQRGYIELSDRATKYLEETGGTGIITSGSEGSHASGTVSHGSGNKIDVVAYGSKDEDWANCAIPFIKNKNTAFINFEDFSIERFNRIKKIIYSKISQDLIDKCERTQKWLNSAKPQPFLTRVTVHNPPQLHLDIGILPNAYDPKTQATQTKTNNVKPIPQTTNKKKQTTKPQPQNTGKPTVINGVGTQNKQQTAGISLDKPDYVNSRYAQLNKQKKNTKT